MHSYIIENVFSFWQRVIIRIFVSHLAISGFLGKLTVYIVFGRGKDLSQSSVNILIFNLAIADMLQCINLVLVIAAIYGITSYEANTWCQFNGFLMQTLVTAVYTFLISHQHE